MTVPVKALSEIEVKSEVSENDKILILDSESEEARLASKDELKWDKWDTWPQWPQGLVWPKWEKGEKWDKWDPWVQWPKGDRWEQGIQWPQWLTGNTWPKWDTWEKWPKGDTWAEIDSAAFVLNDIKFHKDDWTYVTLADAKTILTWPKGDTWNTWPKGDTGAKWDKGDKWDKWDKGNTGASITSAEFDDNDIVFTKDDTTTVVLEDAKSELKWDTWNTWPQWPTWPQWVSVTDFEKIGWTGAAGTLDTYEFTLSDGNTFQFSVYNGANWEWSWDMIAANNLSDLTNFWTARNNLWVYSKSEVDTLISNFWWFEVVATLPSTNIKPNVIYMLWPIWTWPDKYEEWIYTNSTWTKIGETSVDLSNYFNTATQTSDAITEGSSNLFLTPQERTKLGNQSWVNTGDQSASDFDIKDLWDTTGLRDKWTNKQDAISDLATIRTWAGKGATAVQPEDLSAIATSGKLEDATGDADDISEGTNHKFLTSAERTKLGNTSWTNTGDETTASIKTKLGSASTITDWYLTKEDFATFNWKQDTISDLAAIRSWATAWATAVQSWDLKTVKWQSLVGRWDISISEVPSGWTEWQVLTKGSSWYDWGDASWSDYSWVTKTISWWEVELWLRTIVNTPWENFTLTAPATLQDWEEYVIRVINEANYTMTLWTGFTNPFGVDLSLSYYATDQFVFVAVWWNLELQPLFNN